MRFFQRTFQILVVKCLILLLRNQKISRRIILSFDNNIVSDGIGAQLQRILSIAAFAKYMGFGYCHTGIKNLTIQPTDPYNDETTRDDYVEKINNFFNIDNFAFNNHDNEKIYYSVLKPIHLVCTYFKLLFSGKTYELCVAEAYPIIDLHSIIYEEIKSLRLLNLNLLISSVKEYDLVIHFRSGTISQAMYHHQSTSRYLPISYFDNLINLNFEFPDTIHGVCLTDSPKNSFTFKPLDSELQNWIDMPGYNNGVVTIEATDFSLLKDKKIEIVYGGDPLTALATMIRAKCFFMSRSSLSYVGALLNQSSNIFYPPGFWHPKLKAWKN